MAGNQYLEVNVNNIKTFSMVLFEGCQREGACIMQGEYGGKCREKEEQEIQITGIRNSGEKERGSHGADEN